MDDADEYDEFGNYIGGGDGGEFGGDAGEQDGAFDDGAFDDGTGGFYANGAEDGEFGAEDAMDVDGAGAVREREEEPAAEGADALAAQDYSTAIVLHEDKEYYPDASDVYGSAETMLQDEDAQPIEEPIIKPTKTKVFSVLESEAPMTTYDAEFLTGMLDHPSLSRCVAVLGGLGSGKTSFMDALIESTHVGGYTHEGDLNSAAAREAEAEAAAAVGKDAAGRKLRAPVRSRGQHAWSLVGQRRYTDTRKDEQERGISIKCELCRFSMACGL